MRASRSARNPFITDITIIRVATPSAIPSSEKIATIRSNALKITLFSGRSQSVECSFDRYILALAGAAILHLDCSGGEPARPDDELIGQTYQVHRREFRARRFVAVVVKRIDPGIQQFAVNLVSGCPTARVAGAQVDQPDAERRHALRPDDAGIIVVGLDQRADETRHADAIGPHLERRRLAVRAGYEGPHRARILVAEIEDLADFDSPPADDFVAEPRRRLGIMNVVGGSIDPGIAIDDLLERR